MVSDDAGAAEVLAELAAARRRELDAAAATLTLVADWADLHPATDEDDAACIVDRCTGERLPVAGDGTPWVDGLAAVELGAVLGVSTAAALQLLGDSLELRHRLPRLWAATLTGVVPAWRARQVAQTTRSLTIEAAAFVDRQVAVVAGGIGAGRLARLVMAATAEFMPERAEQERAAAAEHRRFDIDLRTGPDGLASVSGHLDLADALDLEAAISDRAAQLGREGWGDSLDVRRSVAAGDLARPQDTLDCADDPADWSTDRPVDVSPRRRPRRRQVVLYVHVSEAALTGSAGVARLENLDRPVLTGAVRGWCARPETQIVVKPVIDLRDTVAVDRYEVPDRIAERVALRDGRCAFPWCNQRRGDVDHVVPSSRGGPTNTENLVLLCRRHHRAKTHRRWRYRIIRPGLYLWTGPHGQRWLRDAYGTHRLE